MDTATIVTIVSVVAAAIGGLVAGKSSHLSSVTSVNQLLTSRIDLLDRQNTEKDAVITRLTSQVDALTNLVTQKAEVAEVKALVETMALRVEAIAGKVGA
jgi:hypothetical protein